MDAGYTQDHKTYNESKRSNRLCIFFVIQSACLGEGCDPNHENVLILTSPLILQSRYTLLLPQLSTCDDRQKKKTCWQIRNYQVLFLCTLYPMIHSYPRSKEFFLSRTYL